MITNNETLKLIFGLKVAYLRQQHNFSYQQLSELTGLSVSYLHDIEKGKKYPKADKIFALAKSFSVDYDELVSIHTNKKLQPIVELVESEFFKMFPLDMFGISTDKLLELFSNTPDKFSAFVSTILKIARNYQMRTEHLYNSALRSYQDLQDNYFSDIEKQVQDFKIECGIVDTLPYSTVFLESLLKSKYNIDVERDMLPKHLQLKNIRSYYAQKNKTLSLNRGLSPAQENFLLARELGFQYMGLKERPYETIILKVETFEKLYNNFKASYFAVALLMEENAIIEEINNFASLSTWDETAFVELLNRYNVTAEMFLQRLTNILPKHFDIKNLFFLRISGDEQLKNYRMTKELHLSRLHNPYANELNEHYCQRWVSIGVLKKLRTLQQIDKHKKLITDIQISKYWQTENEYLCISLAKTNTHNVKESLSVTLGIMIDDKTRRLFRFLNDPSIRHKVVHTTCERCSMTDCNARIAAPVIIERQNEQEEIESLLATF